MATIALRSGRPKGRASTTRPVADVPDVHVRTALVLAAGNGDRFYNVRRQSKLLEPIFGQPLILRTLVSAHDAGITRAEVVLGYEADSLRRVIEPTRRTGWQCISATTPNGSWKTAYPSWRRANA